MQIFSALTLSHILSHAIEVIKELDIHERVNWFLSFALRRKHSDRMFTCNNDNY